MFAFPYVSCVFHKLTRHRHCFIADLRPKAANTPRVKLDGNTASDVNEPIDNLIPQDHPREPLHLCDELVQHAATKKEALDNTDVELPAAKHNPDDELHPTDNKESNKLDSDLLC